MIHEVWVDLDLLQALKKWSLKSKYLTQNSENRVYEGKKVGRSGLAHTYTIVKKKICKFFPPSLLFKILREEGVVKPSFVPKMRGSFPKNYPKDFWL